jgi:carbon storage regulator
MLVLTRKIDQKILIGDNIEITLVAISGDTARIGIEAPKDIKIMRLEVLEEVRDQNLKSAKKPAVSEGLKDLLPKKE